jgi:hypothetical protein
MRVALLRRRALFAYLFPSSERCLLAAQSSFMNKRSCYLVDINRHCRLLLATLGLLLSPAVALAVAHQHRPQAR